MTIKKNVQCKNCWTVDIEYQVKIKCTNKLKLCEQPLNIHTHTTKKRRKNEPTFNVNYIERKKVRALFDNLETMTPINVYKKSLWKFHLFEYGKAIT